MRMSIEKEKKYAHNFCVFSFEGLSLSRRWRFSFAVPRGPISFAENFVIGEIKVDVGYIVYKIDNFISILGELDGDGRILTPFLYFVEFFENLILNVPSFDC